MCSRHARKACSFTIRITRPQCKCQENWAILTPWAISSVLELPEHHGSAVLQNNLGSHGTLLLGVELAQALLLGQLEVCRNLDVAEVGLQCD